MCNGLDQGVIANLALPEGTPPPSGWPGVVLLHGSGGLYNTHGSGDDLGPCSSELQEQFVIWRDLLTARGYAVIMPASFYSRGFCEWGDHDTPRDLDEHERLIVRLFDARAAEDWMCDQSWVDCDRLAVMGFSNGASVALLAMQDDLTVAQDPRLRQLGENRPVRGAVAYYPGCGLDGELASSMDESDRDAFFSPLAPVLVQHAEDDGLLDDCEDFRDPQVAEVARDIGRDEDWFDLHVYNNAHHGFDASDDDDRDADVEASQDAQVLTLSTLAGWFAS